MSFHARVGVCGKVLTWALLGPLSPAKGSRKLKNLIAIFPTLDEMEGQLEGLYHIKTLKFFSEMFSYVFSLVLPKLGILVKLRRLCHTSLLPIVIFQNAGDTKI